MLTLLALLGTATAEDLDYTGLDAHGFWLAPSDGDLVDPVQVFRPERQIPMSFAFTGALEFADSPLVVSQGLSSGEIRRIRVLDDVLTLNLAGQMAFHERVSAGLTVPLYLMSRGEEGLKGPALGDMRLSVPVEVVLATEDAQGFGLAVVPYLDLPTGRTPRFLGNSGFSGGGLVAATVGMGDLAITADLGLGVQSRAAYLNLEGGLYLLAMLAANYQIGEYHGLGVEGWFRPKVPSNAVLFGSESPGEAHLVGRGRYDSGLTWTLGAGTGLTRGASAAIFRLHGSVGWVFGQDEESDRDGDGLIDEEDGCPDVPEVFNGHADEDGCPDGLANLAITVVDEDGTALPDAVLTVGEVDRRLDANASFSLADQMPESRVAASVEHPLCLPVSLDEVLAEGDNAFTMTMPLKPAAVRVVTRANTGEILDAKVQFRGPKPMPDQMVGGDGEETFGLRPGDWEILVSAPAFGVESRELSLAPGETSEIVIEVILEPARVAVETERVVILEKVYFDYNKDTILERSFPLLREVANTIKANPSLLKIEIGGHTDTQGSDASNLDLSERRAASVLRYLVERGVASDRLSSRGYGETVPIDPRSTAEAHAKNRRVEFKIVERSEGAPEVRQAP